MLPTLFHERIHYWQYQKSIEEKNKLVNFYNEFSSEYPYGNMMDYMNLGGYDYYENDDSEDAKFYYLE